MIVYFKEWTFCIESKKCKFDVILCILVCMIGKNNINDKSNHMVTNTKVSILTLLFFFGGVTLSMFDAFKIQFIANLQRLFEKYEFLCLHFMHDPYLYSCICYQCRAYVVSGRMSYQLQSCIQWVSKAANGLNKSESINSWIW